MKIVRYLPVVFAYLLTLVVAINGLSKLPGAIEKMLAGPTIWAGLSGLISGLLSLGLAFFLLRWANSVRTNTRTSQDLAERLAKEPRRAA